jgi:hypothetical protein
MNEALSQVRGPRFEVSGSRLKATARRVGRTVAGCRLWGCVVWWCYGGNTGVLHCVQDDGFFDDCFFIAADAGIRGDGWVCKWGGEGGSGFFVDFGWGAGVDEDAVVLLVVGLDQVVVAVIFAFECGRAATLAAWSLIVEALVVATEVRNWFRHWCTP